MASPYCLRRVRRILNRRIDTLTAQWSSRSGRYRGSYLNRRDLYRHRFFSLIEANGTEDTRLTKDHALDRHPSWSAFIREREPCMVVRATRRHALLVARLLPGCYRVSAAVESKTDWSRRNEGLHSITNIANPCSRYSSTLLKAPSN